MTIPNPRRRALVVTLDRDIETGEPIPVQEGDIVGLVEWVNVSTMTQRGHYLTREPRTNTRHEIRWKGWLGETNGIASYADGKWRITHIAAQAPGDSVEDEPKYIAYLTQVKDDES